MRTVAALLCACLVLGACVKGGGTAPKTVTVFMYSEYIDPDLVTRFEKETGLTVVLDTYENTETMMSKVASAGDQYDVVVVSDHAIRTMASKGTFRQLDSAKTPNAKNVLPRFRAPAYDPDGKWSLP